MRENEEISIKGFGVAVVDNAFVWINEFCERCIISTCVFESINTIKIR